MPFYGYVVVVKKWNEEKKTLGIKQNENKCGQLKTENPLRETDTAYVFKMEIKDQPRIVSHKKNWTGGLFRVSAKRVFPRRAIY